MKRFLLILPLLFLACNTKDNPVAEQPTAIATAPKFNIVITVQYLGYIRQQGYVQNAGHVTAYEVRLRVDRKGKDGNTIWFNPSTMKQNDIRYFDTGSGSEITKLTVGYD